MENRRPVPKLIVPQLTTDQLRAYLAQAPGEVRDDYGLRHFNLFIRIVREFLGTQWVERHILRRALGGVRGQPEYLELDLSTDERRELGSLRLFDLAEMLSALSTG
jgi:hypothetical protein